MSLIEIADVAFTYAAQPGVRALDGVSCAIERGSFVGITGPADAGKTSLCRLIAGYIPHLFDGELSGEVVVDGAPTRRVPVEELAGKVGYVFENPFDQLTGASLTVLEEVAFALENMGLPREEIERRAWESMRLMGIDHLADRHPMRLSGGQSQRVAIASVLAMRPEILLLDEPTSQLDPVGAEEVFETVLRLHQQGLTVIMVSQDLERLSRYADLLLVMRGGRIVLEGEPREVLGRGLASGLPLVMPVPALVGWQLRQAEAVPVSRPLPLTVEEAAAEIEGVLQAGGSDLRAVDPVREGRSGEPQVRLEGVSFSYGGQVRALEDVSLEMDAGCICILGQNGSGKTTLMKHLNGLLKPSSGRVLVRGEDTRDHRVAHLARHVALAFQNPDDQLFRSSVEREVRFGAENMGFPPEEAEKLVERALDLLQLRDVRHRKPYDLGLSWRKRVAIASVLTMASPVVVLDEPTGGQDAEGIQLLGALVEHLVGEGKLVVVVTHDVEFAAEHADRAIALHAGRVLLDGGPREVFAQAEVLARTHVHPPAALLIGQRLGLAPLPLTPQELLAAVGIARQR